MVEDATRSAWSGYALVAVAAVLWALIGPLTKELFDEGVDAATIAFWRATIAGVLFVGHGVITRTLMRPGRRDLALLVGFGLVGVAVFYVALPQAVDAGGVGLAAILLYSAPVFVAVASRLLFGDRLTRRRVVPIVAMLVGVGLVAIGAGGTVARPTAALVWGLVAGLTYASYYVVGRLLGPAYGPAATYAIAFPLGAVALAPRADLGIGGGRAWLLLVVLGVASTYLAYLCFATGLRRVDPTRASVVATLEPVVAIALGAALYDERLGAVTLIGGAIVVVAAGASAAGGRTAALRTVRAGGGP
jgi:drug/metabolite transporter (DMT)-like permease